MVIKKEVAKVKITHSVHLKIISSIPENVLRAWLDQAREDILVKSRKLHQPIEIQTWND
jgi:hypothetical protein